MNVTSLRVITTPRAVPAGFVPMRELGGVNDPLYLFVAHEVRERMLPAVKLMKSPRHFTGPVYLHPDTLATLRAEWDEKQKSKAPADDPAPTVSPPPVGVEALLRQMRDLTYEIKQLRAQVNDVQHEVIRLRQAWS